jgi:hypothetical protein
MTTAILLVCGGFLLAVLWMDLMFDVQVLRHRSDEVIAEPVLASIAAYYRRVTTEASPMNRAVGGAMALLAVTLAVQIASDRGPGWRDVAALLLAGGPSALAALRVVPNAVRLGARRDPAPVQSDLARAICRDHLLCLAAIAGFVALQLHAAR